jgi:myo-inositol 2-dehydrogenase/D-chiro-inositol 1-dehydrogenase/UDP-N-acetylglucosamine 3-dehydrogenase
MRVGLIGAGATAAAYARALKSLIYVDFVGVADPDREKTIELTAIYGGEACQGAADLIRASRPDAVIVATALNSRVASVQVAADSGCAVFVEAPIAATLDDADAMTASCQAAAVKFMVGHLLRFDPCFARAREQLASGSLGEPLYLYTRQLLPRDGPTTAMSAEEQFLRLAVDHFDLIRWLHRGRELKRIESTPVLSAVGDDAALPGLTWSYLEFVDGTLGVVQLGWNLFPSSITRYESQYPSAGDLKLHIVGTQGVLDLDLAQMSMRLVDDDGWHFPDTRFWPNSPSQPVGTLRNALEHFFECLYRDRPPLAGGAEGTEALRLALQARQHLVQPAPLI